MALNLYDFLKKKGISNIQEWVNSNDNGTLNKRNLEKLIHYSINVEGFHLINVKDPNELLYLQPGGRCRYTTNNMCPNPGEIGIENNRYEKSYTRSSANKYRSGGWIISVKTLDDENVDRPYILYRPHVAGIGPQSIQLDYIDKFLYLPPNGSGAKCRKIATFVEPTNYSNFPVILKNENGDDVVVYYAKDNYKMQRFMNSEKMKRALKYGWKFK